MRLTNLNVEVFTGSFAATGNGAANDVDITEALTKFPWVGDVVLQLIVARTEGSSTTDISLLISLDGGTTYTSALAFTQITGASGSEIKTLTVPAGALVKTDINMGSSTTSTITLRACGKVMGTVLNA
jgi:hypothetical protein